MKKPWLTENGGRQLEAFLGSRGMRTSEILTTEELIQTAAGVFEIPMEATCQKMAEVIAGLSKRDRRIKARKNLGPVARRPKRHIAVAGVSALASELGVSADHLRDALRDLAERRKAAAGSQTKTLSQRAVEAARYSTR